MDRDWYINECLGHLNGPTFYRPLDNDITDDIQKRVNVYSDLKHVRATTKPAIIAKRKVTSFRCLGKR